MSSVLAMVNYDCDAISRHRVWFGHIGRRQSEPGSTDLPVCLAIRSSGPEPPGERRNSPAGSLLSSSPGPLVLRGTVSRFSAFSTPAANRWLLLENDGANVDFAPEDAFDGRRLSDRWRFDKLAAHQ